MRPTATASALRRAKEIVRSRQASLFIHVAETRKEREQIAKPMASSPIGHLATLGTLDHHTVRIHCV
ncbi:MAG: hypothetical protein FWF31_11970 [Desulfobulbus sp.]|nr:hypothetical protein [Desulfobulbus sp.]